MSTTKNKWLVIALVILLLSNIAMLSFILFKKPVEKRPFRNGREAMVTEFLQKEVGFNKEQLQQYDTLNKQQRDKMRKRFEDMRGYRQQVYRMLGSQAFSDSAISIAAGQLSAGQKESEENMLRHFASIRQLCTPGQQPKFDSLFYKIWNKMGERKRKPE